MFKLILEDSSVGATVSRCKWLVVAAIAALALAAAWYFMTRLRPLVLEGQDQVLGFSADGRVLATIDQSGKGRLWDTETGKPRNDLAGELAELPFPFSPDGRYRLDLESVDMLRRRVLVETITGEPIFRFSYPADHGFYQKLAFGFTPDGNYLYAPISDAEVTFPATSVWSLPDGNQIYLGKQIALAVSPDGEHLFTAAITENAKAKRLELFNIGDQVVESSFEKLDSYVTSTACVAFSSAGDRVAVCWDGGAMARSQVKVLDIRSKQILAEHEIRSHYLFRPRFIQNDQLIAVNQDSATGPISICLAKSDHSGSEWDLNALSANRQWGVTAYRARDIPTQRFAIDVFKISPDQATGVTNEYPSIKLKFPIDQWGYPSTCDISNDGVRVAVSFDRNYPVRVGNESPTIAVVDIPSQKVIWRWRSGDEPRDLRLSPDGRFVAFNTSSLDPDVNVFRITK